MSWLLMRQMAPAVEDSASTGRRLILSLRSLPRVRACWPDGSSLEHNEAVKRPGKLAKVTIHLQRQRLNESRPAATPDYAAEFKLQPAMLITLLLGHSWVSLCTMGLVKQLLAEQWHECGVWHNAPLGCRRPSKPFVGR